MNTKFGSKKTKNNYNLKCHACIKIQKKPGENFEISIPEKLRYHCHFPVMVSH